MTSILKRTMRLKQTIILLTLLCMAAGLGSGTGQADWTAPIMSDYVKVPIFASYAVKPNIMIILDNSASMNNLAYSDGYTGNPYNGTIKSFPIAAMTDDMEESSNGILRDGPGGGYDLDFGTDYIGLRFQKVVIPQGATITSARITFTSKGNWSSVTPLEIRGEASGDAAFMDEKITKNISTRPITKAAVSWSPGAWGGFDGSKYDTPDLATIVQEIVSRDDWASGNAMLFRFVDPALAFLWSSHREAYSSEQGPDVAPVLHITYLDQSADTRYYGYFNPDYFYKHSSNVFWPMYKKVGYNSTSKSWKVLALDGTPKTLSDSDIAPSVPANGLWDGNWMNWLSMRRVDVLRKVLMGGKATSRTGGGNQQNQGESAVDAKYGPFIKYFNSTDGPATSPYKGGATYEITGKGEVSVGGKLYKIDIQKNVKIEPQDFFEGNLAGILQRIGPRARWGNMWFNEGTGASKSGGFVKNPIDNDFGVNFLPSLQDQVCNTWTPLAETLYVGTQYFAQQPVAAGLDYPNQAQLFGIGENTLNDPYFDKAAKKSIPCTKSFFLLLTDGGSSMDSKIPANLKDFDKDGKDSTACSEDANDCNYPSGGTDFLDDVALYARTTDLRPTLVDNQNVYLYTVLAFEDDPSARSLLMDAARNGGFEDLNGDGKPNGTYTDAPSSRYEWDQDGDAVPDTYYEAKDGYTLEKKLLEAIESILKRASSGTAASVVSNSRSGEGALYQSIFYPANTIAGRTVKWVGQVHALLSDAYGNVREDTNGNKQLDLAEDLFLVYGDELVSKYRDTNANGIFDDTDEGPLVIEGETEFKLNKIKFLWSSTDWLNKLSDPVSQRAPYGSTERRRYIFTFADADGDMAAGSDEVKEFTATRDPSWTEVTSKSSFYTYIHPFAPFKPPLATGTTLPIAPTDADYQPLVQRQIRRVVNFIRGEDQAPDAVGAQVLPAYRNRMIDYDEDGIMETWRLGDVVYSTPTVAGPPAEDFDLIYRDKGYARFYLRHQYRRNVVYVGANDGMIHAFNTGFFDSKKNAFITQPVDNSGNPVKGTYHDFEIGAELWAYVPFNLLAHLHWLTDPDYQHIYYNDLQPRIFDARIYPGRDDDIHPDGWATVMVCGMRFGGGKIAADIDKDGTYNPAVDKAMSSAFAIFDITNPEEPPKLLGEITFPELGFTTCHPGVIPVRDFDPLTHEQNSNQWYLIFGSGPVSPDASGVNGANTTALTFATSSQNAVIYAVDLVALANDHKVVTLTPEPASYSAATAAQPYYLTRLTDTLSSVSKPIAVDWNLDFNTDAVYFGVSRGNYSVSTGWHGKMRRLVLDDGTNDPTVSTSWKLDSTLLDLKKDVPLSNGQPIMASATAGTDNAGNRWIFFGTGRFYAEDDKKNLDQQSYYGVKEPYTVKDGAKIFNYSQVAVNNLLDVTKINVYESGDYLDNFAGTFNKLTTFIEDYKQGWRMNFDYKPQGERNLGEAVLAGDVLTFTTFVPSQDPCSVGGESQVYALYYRTGTAYKRSIIGVDPTRKVNENALVLKRLSLGTGMTITPNIHVGREEGSRAYIQTSTGAIKPLEQENPGVVKSGKMPFIPGEQTCP